MDNIFYIASSSLQWAIPLIPLSGPQWDSGSKPSRWYYQNFVDTNQTNPDLGNISKMILPSTTSIAKWKSQNRKKDQMTRSIPPKMIKWKLNNFLETTTVGREVGIGNQAFWINIPLLCQFCYKNTMYIQEMGERAGRQVSGSRKKRGNPRQGEKSLWWWEGTKGKYSEDIIDFNFPLTKTGGLSNRDFAI